MHYLVSYTMDVFFSTVVRRSPIQKGGELVCVDWTTKKVIARKPLAPIDPLITDDDDPNPRGNARGGRGIFKYNDTLYVAIYHSLILFDTSLNIKGKITNNLFVGLHEACCNDNEIWVASTAIDGAICINPDGELIDSWWVRENSTTQRIFSLEPLSINKNVDNRLIWLKVQPNKQPSHTHLNAVAVNNGQLHVLLNKFGVVYNTKTNNIVLEDTSIIGCHNLVFLGERMLINDSLGKRVMVYSHTGKLIKEIDLLAYPEVSAIHNEEAPNFYGTRRVFVRGLSPVSDDRILVGFSPATIVEIDLNNGRLLDLYRYSNDIAVCVHGLLVWT